MNITQAAQLPHPFNFYKLLLDSDALHFGYWAENQPKLSLEQAQEAMTDLLLARFPAPPAKVLDVGCGLGATAGRLVKQGYSVTALAPSVELIAYAKQYNPGAHYLVCGLLDELPEVMPPHRYDVIILQESLQYLPDLHAVFARLKSLLNPDGRIVLGDEVSYSTETQAHSSVHQAMQIEQAFAHHGFYVTYHEKMGNNVLPTCEESVKRFNERRAYLLEQCGDEARTLLAHYTEGWNYQENMYRSGKMGYEIWELRPSDFCLRAYQEGDEYKILSAFNQAFQVQRQQAHWYWKYRDNPAGGLCATTAWQGETLAAHYSGYPLRLSLEPQRLAAVQHVGDTFTMPAFRGVGQGTSSLLARVFQHFERRYFENKVTFAYGFNTHKIRRFGQLFLGYVADTPVYSWQLAPERMRRYHRAKLRWVRLRGYSVSRETVVGQWADTLFQRARADYPWLVARDQSYLRWRYELHPDFEYEFYVIQYWGQVVGWWLVRKQARSLYLGDALFCRHHAPIAMAAGLTTMLHQHPDTDVVEGWFAQTPQWWIDRLQQAGFSAIRQRDELYLCLKSYTPDLSPAQIAERFYFTWGDSDLF